AAARRMGPDAARAATPPGRTRPALDHPATGAPATNPGPSDALVENDSGATRAGQRSLPQIPVAAAGTTPRLARALAHDDARTTPPLGHRARGQAGSDASARAAKSLSVRRGVTVVNAGARREILNGALQNVKQDS